jgi:hypothetical protein
MAGDLVVNTPGYSLEKFAISAAKTARCLTLSASA